MSRRRLDHMENPEKTKTIDQALAELKPNIENGLINKTIIKTIIKKYKPYADAILLIYSHRLSMYGHEQEASMGFKMLCELYDKGTLDNSNSYSKARVYLTYVCRLTIDENADNFQEILSIAHRYVNKAIFIDSDYQEAKLSRCFLLDINKRYDESDKKYQQILEQHPDYQEAYCCYGTFLIRQNKFPDAIAHFEETIERFPENAKALWLYALFISHYYDGDSDLTKAIGLCTQALSILEKMPEPSDKNIRLKFKIYLALGIIYNKIGDPPSARAAFAEANAIKPNDADLADLTSAKTHQLQNKASKKGGAQASKDKVGNLFDKAFRLKPARIMKKQSRPQASPTVYVVDSQPEKKPIDYQQLAAKLKFNKEAEEVAKELSNFEHLYLQLNEFSLLYDALDYAQGLADGLLFAEAYAHLKSAREQYLPKLNMVQLVQTNNLREFDPVSRALIPVSTKPRETLPEKMSYRPPLHVSAPAETKKILPEEKVAENQRPLLTATTPQRRDCFRLIIMINNLLGPHPTILKLDHNKSLQNQLDVANKLFESECYPDAHKRMLEIIEEIKARIETIKKSQTVIKSVAPATVQVSAKKETQVPEIPLVKSRKHKQRKKTQLSENNASTFFQSKKINTAPYPPVDLTTMLCISVSCVAFVLLFYFCKNIMGALSYTPHNNSNKF